MDRASPTQPLPEAEAQRALARKAEPRPADPSAFIDEVERRIVAALQWTDAPPDPDVLGQAARHLCIAHEAKRARPHLVHLFGTALGADPSSMADISVAGEFIHTASLLHDDVIDRGTSRRGKATANHIWGNLAAVLSGDLLMVRGLEVLIDLPRPITNDAHALIASMTRAALLEAQGRHQADLSLDAWRHIAEGKTGALLGWCGRAVARLTGDDDALERFDRAGRHLGVAYQLGDDLRDLSRADEGKDRFADIQNANPSYPLLWAAARDAQLRADLNAARARAAATVPGGTLPMDEAHALGLRVLRSGAAEATVAAIHVEATAAIAALGDYGERPGGRELVTWIRLLLFRSLATTEEA